MHRRVGLLLRSEKLTVAGECEAAAGAPCRLLNMKATNRPSDNLSDTLRTWRTNATLPPRFQEGVWRRIEQQEAKSHFAFLAAVRVWIENSLPRPKITLCYVTTLLLLGLVSGFWTAKGESRRLNAYLGSRYMQSVDPYYDAK